MAGVVQGNLQAAVSAIELARSSAVIVRESGRSSIHDCCQSALLCLNRLHAEYWMPAFAGMTI